MTTLRCIVQPQCRVWNIGTEITHVRKENPFRFFSFLFFRFWKKVELKIDHHPTRKSLLSTNIPDRVLMLQGSVE